MAERIAQIHQNTSNRAQKSNTQKKNQKKQNEKQSQQSEDTQSVVTGQAKPSSSGTKKKATTTAPVASDKKVVYRSVLDNPFRIDWPRVPSNVENSILACIVELLSPIAPYHIERDKCSRQKKRTSRAERPLRQPQQTSIGKEKARRGKKGKGKETQQKDSSNTHFKETEEEPMTVEVEPPLQKPSIESHSCKAALEEPPKVTGKRKKAAGQGEAVTGIDSDDENTRRKRRKADSGQPQPLPRATSAQLHDEGTTPIPPHPLFESNPSILPSRPLVPRPDILNHITFGVNEVTKRLELQSPAYTWLRGESGSTVSDGTKTSAKNHSPIRLVLVNRSDIETPAIIAHFPTLVAACNSAQATTTQQGGDTAQLNAIPVDGAVDDISVPPMKTVVPAVLLVALPRGAEESVAAAVGMRRVAVVALDSETPGIERLSSLLTSVPILKASWLGSTPALIPTHIKQLRTTAPKDMKLAKNKRLKDKAAAKEVKRAKRLHSRQKPQEAGTKDEKRRRGKVSRKPTIVFSAAAARPIVEGASIASV